MPDRTHGLETTFAAVKALGLSVEKAKAAVPEWWEAVPVDGPDGVDAALVQYAQLRIVKALGIRYSVLHEAHQRAMHGIA